MKRRFLSEKDFLNFRRDGFLIVPGMVTTREISEVSRWIDEITSWAPQKDRQMVYYEDSLLKKGEKILSRIEKFVDYHESLRAFVHDERMIGRASELLGEAAVLFKEKINFKLPGGGGFKPHQDIQPGWDNYAPYFTSALVTVDESNARNGCLELAAGHHKRGMIGKSWKPLENKELEGIEFKKYPMAPGDAAFFDCFVPHQSEANLTGKPRRNLYLTFNRLSDGDHREKYFVDKRKSYPPDNEREAGKKYVFRV